MPLSKPAPVLTCLVLAAVSLLTGCTDKTYPGYDPGMRDACKGLTCTEGLCTDFGTLAPLCASAGPDGGVGEGLPDEPYRLALPSDFIPLPATGAPVEGTFEVAALLTDTGSRYFEFEATGQHLYRLTATCEGTEGCSVLVADARGMTFHQASDSFSGIAGQLDTLFRPTRAGRHVIALTSRNAQRVNRYSVQLQSVPDDHGDLAESATLLAEGDVSFEGTLQAHADTDVFSFPARAEERFQVLCTLPGTSQQTASLTKVFSASGELPAEGRAEDGIVRTTEAGPHFIHVAQASSDRAMPLSYRCGLRKLDAR